MKKTNLILTGLCAFALSAHALAYSTAFSIDNVDSSSTAVVHVRCDKNQTDERANADFYKGQARAYFWDGEMYFQGPTYCFVTYSYNSAPDLPGAYIYVNPSTENVTANSVNPHIVIGKDSYGKTISYKESVPSN